MSGGPVKNPVESLRNTRRSIGDGTLGGRSRIATPYDPRRLRNAVRSVSSSSAIPQGELLAISGTAVTVAGGGSTLASLAETIQAQSGFTSVDSAGDVPTLPLSGSYVAEVDVRWTDGYRGGGTVRVLLAGAGIEEVWPTAHTSEPWCRWVDQVTFAGVLGETFDVEVTPDDGASHTADVTVRLAVVEPLRTIASAPVATSALAFTGGKSFDSDEDNIITRTVSPPADVVEGEIMLLFAFLDATTGNTTTTTMNTPSGWTELVEYVPGTSAVQRLKAYGRVATAADEAGSTSYDVTSTTDGSGAFGFLNSTFMYTAITALESQVTPTFGSTVTDTQAATAGTTQTITAPALSPDSAGAVFLMHPAADNISSEQAYGSIDSPSTQLARFTGTNRDVVFVVGTVPSGSTAQGTLDSTAHSGSDTEGIIGVFPVSEGLA